jgi:hypothetical protein
MLNGWVDNRPGHASSPDFWREPAAVDLLASRLCTPLQIEQQHLTLALDTGYQASEKPTGEAIVDSVLSTSRSTTWNRPCPGTATRRRC